MGSVVVRYRTTVVSGYIRHHERPSSFEQAEKITRRRLDRRKNYCIIRGKVCEAVEWSRCCSGCCEGPEYGCKGERCRGGGCGECGYTGRSRRGQWVPVTRGQAYA